MGYLLQFMIGIVANERRPIESFESVMWPVIDKSVLCI